MKGQQEVLSVVLISGILIGVVGSVYFWGVPLVQKNKDVAMLEGAETFMKTLDTRLKYVANNGGRDQLTVSVPGIVKFDPAADTITLTIDTEGTIYASGADIPLSRNSVCSATTGVFGTDDPDVICVKSTKLSENKYRTVYTLKYLKLVNSNVIKDYSIALQGTAKSGGQQSRVSFENLGNTQVTSGRTLISTLIEINIV